MLTAAKQRVFDKIRRRQPYRSKEYILNLVSAIADDENVRPFTAPVNKSPTSVLTSMDRFTKEEAVEAARKVGIKRKNILHAIRYQKTKEVLIAKDGYFCWADNKFHGKASDVSRQLILASKTTSCVQHREEMASAGFVMTPSNISAYLNLHKRYGLIRPTGKYLPTGGQIYDVVDNC